MGKNIKGIISLLIIIIVMLLILCILLATGTISFNSNMTNSNQQSSENNISNDENINNQENIPIQDELGKNDTFSTNDESGIVEVIGYPETKELIDGMNDGEKYNYVYFHIKETKSDEFKKYIDSLKGNSFVLENAIGLGCIIDSKIKYSNSYDDAKLEGYELSEEDSNKILNATESNPIKLKLEKLPLTYSGGAPICYSHITTIEVVD